VDRGVVVLGGGSAAEAFCAALRRLDASVPITLVERELIGGECSYYACMPSKTLLRGPELVAEAHRAPGVTSNVDPSLIFEWRDKVVDGWGDAGHVDWLGDRNVTVVRGEGRVVAPGKVAAGSEELEYDRLVVATGSSPTIPPLPGLDRDDYRTTREATSAHEVPTSLVVLGGGAAGCELAQAYRRLGSQVTIVQRSSRLMPRVHPDAAALLQDAFTEEGIELRLGDAVELVEPGVKVHLATGEILEADRLLVATGRSPNVDGLEPLGLTTTPTGIQVDDELRAAENVWAIGDVNGIAQLTHVGKYQGRVAAVNVAGGHAKAHHEAIPGVAFTDPQIAMVGTTDDASLVSAEWRIDRTSRTSTYERPKRPGFVRVYADPDRRTVAGAVAVGPESGEWLQQLTVAIRAQVPVDVLRDVIQPYPTFAEAVFFAVRDLPL
jgi:pyruvate/2-oxoglutarate dehydrogenase complex dihydrolipoamide dehydrogenase (E3) component